MYPFAICVQVFGTIDVVVIVFVVIRFCQPFGHDLFAVIDPTVKIIHRGKNSMRVPFARIITGKRKHGRANRTERKTGIRRIYPRFAFARNGHANLVAAGVDPIFARL
jgi:hypothetical protein